MREMKNKTSRRRRGNSLRSSSFSRLFSLSLSRFDVFCVTFASLAFVFVGWVVVLRHRSLSGLAFDSFLGVTFISLLLFDILKTPREDICIELTGEKNETKN
jgi:hypothetical protein